MHELEKRDEVLPAGQALVKIICERFSARGAKIHRAHLATIGRHGRTLLEDGMDFDLVVAAAEIALRRGAPQHLGFIAHDLEMTRTGNRLTRRDYERGLEDELEIQAREAKRERPRRSGDHSHG